MLIAPQRTPAVCVLGSLNIDLIVRTPSLPAPGQTVLGGPVSLAPGGKGANQAVAAARMGARVAMIGCLGEDTHADLLRQALADESIDITHVVPRPHATGMAIITVEESSENTIVVAPGANAALTPDDVQRAAGAIAEADVLLLQLESPLDAVRAGVKTAMENGVMVLLNAAPIPAEPREIMDILPGVDALVVNETEALALRSLCLGPGEDDPEFGEAATLLGLGIRLVVVTQGSRGASAAHGREMRVTTPAFQVAAIDAVGAGDAFVGALAVRLAEIRCENRRSDGFDRLELLDALSWACAAGALATTRQGAIPSIPTRAEIRSLLAQSA